MYMCVCSPCVSLVLQKPEDCIGSPGRVCGCWELNPGPLQAQQVLLASEPVSTHFYQDKCKNKAIHEFQNQQ